MVRTPRKILFEKLDSAKKVIKVGDKYMHTKSGGEYEVIALVIREDNEEIRVIYKELNRKPPIIWDRSYDGKDGWIVKTVLDGKKVDRFKKLKP